MNLRKHIDGFAVFLIVLTSVVCINEYLTQGWKVPRARVAAPLPQATVDKQQPVNFDVRQVSLDFIKGKSYTTLTLKREAGQFAPRKLWVTTFFFAQGDGTRGSWTSQVEIDRPFANGGDQIELTATDECQWDAFSDTPRVAYFARVYVSTEDYDNSYRANGRLSHDITTAMPVVVHWPEMMKPSAITSKDAPAGKINFSDR
jgi:hypothetical protein